MVLFDFLFTFSVDFAEGSVLDCGDLFNGGLGLVLKLEFGKWSGGT